VRMRWRVGAAWCGLIVALAACGGGSERLSAAGYAREAGKLCARANRAVGRVELPTVPDHSTAGRLERVVAIQRHAIDDLRALRPPTRLSSLVQRWIALLDQATDELERMRDQLRIGRTAEASAYGEKAATLSARARELVAPLHQTSCLGPPLAAP